LGPANRLETNVLEDGRKNERLTQGVINVASGLFSVQMADRVNSPHFSEFSAPDSTYFALPQYRVTVWHIQRRELDRLQPRTITTWVRRWLRFPSLFRRNTLGKQHTSTIQHWWWYLLSNPPLDISQEPVERRSLSFPVDRGLLLPAPLHRCYSSTVRV